MSVEKVFNFANFYETNFHRDSVRSRSSWNFNFIRCGFRRIFQTIYYKLSQSPHQTMKMSTTLITICVCALKFHSWWANMKKKTQKMLWIKKRPRFSASLMFWSQQIVPGYFTKGATHILPPFRNREQGIGLLRRTVSRATLKPSEEPTREQKDPRFVGSRLSNCDIAFFLLCFSHPVPRHFFTLHQGAPKLFFQLHSFSRGPYKFLHDEKSADIFFCPLFLPPTGNYVGAADQTRGWCSQREAPRERSDLKRQKKTYVDKKRRI